ncbi:IS1 family transposase, partial [Shigella sonnei]|uniref:IS1 family transposase n=1 Tax=Shigella sonnei TaxID=624 RepID=UPI00311AA757
MASVSISCPSCSATDGVVRNGKSTAGHQRYLCSHCRKTFLFYTSSIPRDSITSSMPAFPCKTKILH